MARRLLRRKRPSGCCPWPHGRGETEREAFLPFGVSIPARSCPGSLWLKERRFTFIGPLLCVRCSVWCGGAFTKPRVIYPQVSLGFPWFGPVFLLGRGQLRLRKVEHLPRGCPSCLRARAPAPLRASSGGRCFSPARPWEC